MTDRRPPLKRVVFNYQVEDGLVDLVRNALPDATVAIATDDDIVEQVRDTQLLIGGRLSEEALANANALAWQHVTWAGVEGILTENLPKRGVVLTNSRGVSAPNMAEHVVAMMLAFGRAIPLFVKQQQDRRWRGWYDRPAFFELTDQAVVLLGTGAIGKAIAHRLRPFGCRIIGARRTSSPVAGFDDVVGFGDLPDVLPTADHVVSSLPMTPHTKGIVSADMIEQFKPGAHFFNVGRGGTVDQDALIAALRSGHLGGAGLDVTDPEPLPEDSPLWGMENVLITGHTSGSSPMVGNRVRGILLENLRRYQAGEELLNVVDYEQGY